MPILHGLRTFIQTVGNFIRSRLAKNHEDDLQIWEIGAKSFKALLDISAPEEENGHWLWVKGNSHVPSSSAEFVRESPIQTKAFVNQAIHS